MQFDSLQSFLQMGGYAAYVWASFGVCFASLLILIFFSATKERKILKEIATKLEREQRLKDIRRKKNES
ncbi:heme exporter protein CcmD [Shewanella sp. 202IG2-18]|uniref:heme exporter protein CcmD n=1 Tax=Parashewanella hymeniacidonis TaxID=2807618 RepID=UPI0019611B63|nr:heme exporter protein CcmD [Parashewanella hymeniacidonis]MBM7072973.1 heme exporter protein CcmD [Parashewanella hymeniacidonis]